MDLDTIGAALKRKLGPLPVWVWAIIGGMVLYFLRSKGYFGGAGADQGETLQPRQADAREPQQSTLLQPGESVYDPNTGTLSTAPGGGGGDAIGGGVGEPTTPVDTNDTAQALEDLAAAILGNQTDSDKPNSAAPRTHKPTALDRAKAAVVTGKLGPKNKARLTKAGYSAAQISYHLRRHTALGKPRAKTTKPAHTQKPGNTTKKPNNDAGSKPGKHKPVTTHKETTPRSKTHTRSTTTHRKPSTKAHGKAATPKARAAVQPSASGPRQRPKVAAVSHTTPVHHPVSSGHSSAAKKTSAAHAAAPSHGGNASSRRAPAPPKQAAPPPPKRKHKK